MKVLAMILAGGAGKGLSVLTSRRAVAAVPFGGKYRAIDFSLSNSVNSGIYNVAVLTQFWPRGLNDHIGVGKPWDLDRLHGGVRLLHPFPTPGQMWWQQGTADALFQNLDFIIEQNPTHVLVLAGDHIYKMDYRTLLAFHEDKDADFTIAVLTVQKHKAHQFGIVDTDPDGRVVAFQEKPERAFSTLASMGVYAFNTEYLVETLRRRAQDFPGLDMARDLIPDMVKDGKVYAYRYAGYWADIDTVNAYWEAHQALLADPPALELNDPQWVIHTRSEERPAVYIGESAEVDGSMISDGARIEGTVKRSVISPGVYVAPGATVRDAIVLTDAVIETGATVERAIIDKRVRVKEEAKVGSGERMVPNQEEPDVVNIGLVLIGKDAEIPSGITIGRNVVIYPDVKERDFDGFGGNVPSGETVKPGK